MSNIVAMMDTAESRILDAANELFCEQGVEAVGTAAIAKRAGVTKALVFYHFQTKAAVCRAVMARHRGAIDANLSKAVAGSGSIRDRIEAMVMSYVDFLEKNPGFARLVQDDWIRRDPDIALAETNAYRMKLLVDLLDHAGVAPDEARQLFISFVGMIHFYFANALVLAPASSRNDLFHSSALAQRRAHIQWMLRVVLDALDVRTSK